jgi:hypothetical protein
MTEILFRTGEKIEVSESISEIYSLDRSTDSPVLTLTLASSSEAIPVDFRRVSGLTNLAPFHPTAFTLSYNGQTVKIPPTMVLNSDARRILTYLNIKKFGLGLSYDEMKVEKLGEFSYQLVLSTAGKKIVLPISVTDQQSGNIPSRRRPKAP